MEQAQKLLQKYLPEAAVKKVVELLFQHDDLYLKITKQRHTKLGDYKKINFRQHKITVNHNLNPYQFLITLLHEIAHYLAFKEYGHHIKPHGKEWKKVFGLLLQDYLSPEIFPQDILPYIRQYARNPKASTAGDGTLHLKLSSYNTGKNPDTRYIFELSQGQIFALPNGVRYRLQEKRRTRYKCLRLDNRKIYLIHQNAEVFPLSNETLS